MALLRSRNYLRLLVLAAILGVPISAVAYGFLALVSYLQKEIFTHLPHGLGYATEPVWWPLPVLAAGGALAGFAIGYLPGKGGPSAAGPFAVHAPPTAVQLPGVILAALASDGLALMPLVIVAVVVATSPPPTSRRIRPRSRTETGRRAAVLTPILPRRREAAQRNPSARGRTGHNVTNRCHGGARISSSPVPHNPSVHNLAGYTIAFRDLGHWHAIHGFQHGPPCLPGHVQRHAPPR